MGPSVGGVSTTIPPKKNNSCNRWTQEYECADGSCRWREASCQSESCSDWGGSYIKCPGVGNCVTSDKYCLRPCGLVNPGRVSVEKNIYSESCPHHPGLCALQHQTCPRSAECIVKRRRHIGHNLGSGFYTSLRGECWSRCSRQDGCAGATLYPSRLCFLHDKIDLDNVEATPGFTLYVKNCDKKLNDTENFCRFVSPVYCKEEDRCVSENSYCVRSAQCPAGSSPCLTTGSCFVEHELCDGIRQCPDGYDERNCPGDTYSGGGGSVTIDVSTEMAYLIVVAILIAAGISCFFSIYKRRQRRQRRLNEQRRLAPQSGADENRTISGTTSGGAQRTGRSVGFTGERLETQAARRQRQLEADLDRLLYDPLISRNRDPVNNDYGAPAYPGPPVQQPPPYPAPVLTSYPGEDGTRAPPSEPEVHQEDEDDPPPPYEEVMHITGGCRVPPVYTVTQTDNSRH